MKKVILISICLLINKLKVVWVTYLWMVKMKILPNFYPRKHVCNDNSKNWLSNKKYIKTNIECHSVIKKSNSRINSCYFPNVKKFIRLNVRIG